MTVRVGLKYNGCSISGSTENVQRALWNDGLLTIVPELLYHVNRGMPGQARARNLPAAEFNSAMKSFFDMGDGQRRKRGIIRMLVVDGNNVNACPAAIPGRIKLETAIDDPLSAVRLRESKTRVCGGAKEYDAQILLKPDENIILSRPEHEALFLKRPSKANDSNVTKRRSRW